MGRRAVSQKDRDKRAWPEEMAPMGGDEGTVRGVDEEVREGKGHKCGGEISPGEEEAE